jgi:hypothetical protein
VIVVNGERIEILENGSIKVFSKKKSNVLLVKNCASNLLSIRKITSELNCYLIFSSKNMIFQNVISEGLMKNGIYYLYQTNSISIEHPLASENWASVR